MVRTQTLKDWRGRHENQEKICGKENPPHQLEDTSGRGKADSVPTATPGSQTVTGPDVDGTRNGYEEGGKGSMQYVIYPKQFQSMDAGTRR